MDTQDENVWVIPVIDWQMKLFIPCGVCTFLLHHCFCATWPKSNRYKWIWQMTQNEKTLNPRLTIIKILNSYNSENTLLGLKMNLKIHTKCLEP